MRSLGLSRAPVLATASAGRSSVVSLRRAVPLAAAPATRFPSSSLSSSSTIEKPPRASSLLLPVPARAAPAAADATATAEVSSLYERLGGDAIKLVTSMLFDKLLADPEIGHFFEAETLPKHKAIVSRFLIGAMGGPDEYKGRNMVDAHIGLVDLRYPEDFNIVANALSAVLAELDVPAQETSDVMALVGTLEPDFKKIAKFRKMMEEDAE